MAEITLQEINLLKDKILKMDVPLHCGLTGIAYGRQVLINFLFQTQLSKEMQWYFSSGRFYNKHSEDWQYGVAVVTKVIIDEINSLLESKNSVLKMYVFKNN